MSKMLHRLHRGLVLAVLAGGLAGGAKASRAATDLTYLLPAPANAIAFAPLMLAQHKNYYQDEGLNVRFVSVKGGADVGKQLGAGNADLGGALGDTPIILRPNGIPIKGVALLGGGALHQLMTREDKGIRTPSDLKEKMLTVVAYQDTSFFATLAVLGQAGLTRTDLDIQAAGPMGVWQLVAAGKSDGMVAAPEMGAFAEEEGVKLIWRSTGEYFPGMAQAIMASEAKIKEDPETIRKFVRATLKALSDIRENPDEAAKTYVEAVPTYKGREALVKKVLGYYASHVYPGQSQLGEFDAQRVEALQNFYAENGIITQKSPVESLFTNEFVH